MNRALTFWRIFDSLIPPAFNIFGTDGEGFNGPPIDAVEAVGKLKAD